MENGMPLFTYGSLMFAPVWERVTGPRGLGARSVAGSVHGWAAFAVRGEVFPGLSVKPGTTTSGRVYLDLPPDVIARLDAFEGDFYVREKIEVTLEDGTVLWAQVYRVAEAFLAALEDHPWDAETFRQRHQATFGLT
jgi:gamma-glutamylcyclotransferase (GGCT)/AIG2-like uncharacterized protein YtfP